MLGVTPILIPVLFFICFDNKEEYSSINLLFDGYIIYVCSFNINFFSFELSSDLIIWISLSLNIL